MNQEPENEEILTDEEGANVESSNPNAFREAAIRFMDYADRRDMFVAGYEGNRLLAYECTLLALGKAEFLGKPPGKHEKWSQVALAERHLVKKATVSKIVKKFQGAMGIPPMPGQRSLEACQKFSEVRKSQLQKP